MCESGEAGDSACFFAGGGIVAAPVASFIFASVGVVGCDESPPLSFSFAPRLVCAGGDGGGGGIAVPSNAFAKSKFELGISSGLKFTGGAIAEL